MDDHFVPIIPDPSLPDSLLNVFVVADEHHLLLLDLGFYVAAGWILSIWDYVGLSFYYL